MEIITGVIIVVVVGGIAFAARANWSAHMGMNLGREYMKEFGIDDGQGKNHDTAEEEKKRE